MDRKMNKFQRPSTPRTSTSRRIATGLRRLAQNLATLEDLVSVMHSHAAQVLDSTRARRGPPLTETSLSRPPSPSPSPRHVPASARASGAAACPPWAWLLSDLAERLYVPQRVPPLPPPYMWAVPAPPPPPPPHRSYLFAARRTSASSGSSAVTALAASSSTSLATRTSASFSSLPPASASGLLLPEVPSREMRATEALAAIEPSPPRTPPPPPPPPSPAPPAQPISQQTPTSRRALRTRRRRRHRLPVCVLRALAAALRHAPAPAPRATPRAPSGDRGDGGGTALQVAPGAVGTAFPSPATAAESATVAAAGHPRLRFTFHAGSHVSVDAVGARSPLRLILDEDGGLRMGTVASAAGRRGACEHSPSLGYSVAQSPGEEAMALSPAAAAAGVAAKCVCPRPCGGVPAVAEAASASASACARGAEAGVRRAQQSEGPVDAACQAEPETTSQTTAIGNEEHEKKTKEASAESATNATTSAEMARDMETEAAAAAAAAAEEVRLEPKARAGVRAKRTTAREADSDAGPRVGGQRVGVSLREGRAVYPLPISQWRLNPKGELLLTCVLPRPRPRPRHRLRLRPRPRHGRAQPPAIGKPEADEATPDAAATNQLVGGPSADASPGENSSGALSETQFTPTPISSSLTESLMHASLSTLTMPSAPAIPSTATSKSQASSIPLPATQTSQGSPHAVMSPGTLNSHCPHDKNSMAAKGRNSYNLPESESVIDVLTTNNATQTLNANNQLAKQESVRCDQCDERSLLQSLILQLLETHLAFSISSDVSSTQELTEANLRKGQSLTNTDSVIHSDALGAHQDSDISNYSTTKCSDVAAQQKGITSSASPLEIKKTPNENTLYLEEVIEDFSSVTQQNAGAARHFIQPPSADDMREIPARKMYPTQVQTTTNLDSQQSLQTDAKCLSSIDDVAAVIKAPHNIIRQSYDSNHLSQTSPNVIGDDQDLQHEAIEIHCYHQQASHIISADQKSPCFHKSASHQLLQLGKESLQLSPLTQNQEIQQPPPTHTLVELLEASEVYRIFTTDQQNLSCPAGKKVRRTHHLTVDKSHLQHFPATEKCHNQVTSEFVTKSTRNSFASSAKQYSFSDLQNLKENENLPANPIGIIKQSPSLSYVGNVRRSSSLNLDEKALGTQYLQLISTDTEADLGCNIAVKSSATDPGAQQSLAFSKLYNKKQIPNELLHSETPRANNKSIKSTLSAEKNISQPAENLLFTLHHVADKFPDKNVTMSGYDQPLTSEIHHSELLLQNDTSLNNQSFEEIKIKQHSKASTDMHSLLVNDEQFIHACLLSQTDQSEIDMQRGHISITSVQLEKSLDDTVQYIPQSSRIDKQECHTSLEPSPVNDSAFNVRPSKQHPTDITWVKKLSMPETLSIGIGPKDVNHNFHPPSDIGRMSTESETRNLRKSSSTNTKLPALTLSECTENSASQYMDSSTECPPHSALSTSTDSTCVNTLSEGHQSSMKSMLTAVVTTPSSPKDTDPRQDISARHKCCVSLLTSTKLRTFNSNDDADKPSNEVSDATEESRGKEAERANGSQFSLYYLFQCATETSNSSCTVEDINLELTAEAIAVKVENDKKDELNKRGDSASSSLIVTSEVHQPAGSGSSSGGHRRRRRRGRRRRVVRPSSAGGSGSGRGGGGGGGAGTAAEAAPRARCKRRPLLRRVRDVLRAHLASRRRRLASPPCLYLLRPSHARCPASTSVLNAQRHSLPSASAVDPADGV